MDMYIQKRDAGIKEQVKKLKEEVREMVVVATDKRSEELNLINDIQRLRKLNNLHKGDIPTMEEYMHVALASDINHTLTTTSFLGMGDLATTGSFDWVANDLLIVRALSLICRLTSFCVFANRRMLHETTWFSKEETYAEF
ncbi:hypothetical protein RJ639_022825 [Escallonia herrerae]|uniref:Terpene synthase metal-binding domain-containing protein n=1 Tax=Escallonia herrerae TaxID=1293975 RepID=A0AA88V075_9ASTE|nr:hypothetical protein RJ639_022825 [Escallonia herrerae]